MFYLKCFVVLNRRSIAQESLQHTRNEKSRYTNQSSNKLASIERHDPNRNKCHKLNDMISTDRNNLNGNLNSANSNSDGNVMGSTSIVMRDRYQHPALITIMNEMQGLNFRGTKEILTQTFLIHFHGNCFGFSQSLFYSVHFNIYFNFEFDFNLFIFQSVHIQIINKKPGYYNNNSITLRIRQAQDDVHTSQHQHVSRIYLNDTKT